MCRRGLGAAVPGIRPFSEEKRDHQIWAMNLGIGAYSEEQRAVSLGYSALRTLWDQTF